MGASRQIGRRILHEGRWPGGAFFPIPPGLSKREGRDGPHTPFLGRLSRHRLFFPRTSGVAYYHCYTLLRRPRRSFPDTKLPGKISSTLLFLSPTCENGKNFRIWPYVGSIRLSIHACQALEKEKGNKKQYLGGSFVLLVQT